MISLFMISLALNMMGFVTVLIIMPIALIIEFLKLILKR